MSDVNRDQLLRDIAQQIPYIQFLGVGFTRNGDELTANLSFHPDHIGYPQLPALHGGVSAAFLEATAIVTLTWANMGKAGAQSNVIDLPKTIDFTVDYLRAGQPRDAHARAIINRSGRRYASVFVEGWQENKNRPFVQATGHFLMAGRDD